MAAFHAVLTLTGSVQTLSTVLPTGWPTTAHLVTLQADSGNANVIYGGTNVGTAVTSSNYGFRIEVPVTSIPAAPLVLAFGGGTALDLSQITVLGTNTEKLHVFLNT